MPFLSAYKENNDVFFGDMRALLNFNDLEDKVAYKLIQREKNQELLMDVPYIEFLDLWYSILFWMSIEGDK